VDDDDTDGTDDDSRWNYTRPSAVRVRGRRLSHHNHGPAWTWAPAVSADYEHGRPLAVNQPRCECHNCTKNRAQQGFIEYELRRRGVDPWHTVAEVEAEMNADDARLSN